MLTLLRYTVRLDPRRGSALVVIAGLRGALWFVVPVLVGVVASAFYGVVEDGLDATFVILLGGLVCGLVGGYVLDQVSSYLNQVLSGLMQRDHSARLASAMSVDPSIAALDDPERAAQVANVRSRSMKIEIAVRNGAIPMVTQLVGLVGTSVTIGFVLAWWAPVLLFGMYAVEAVVLARTGVGRMRRLRIRGEEQTQAAYALAMGMSPEAAKETRIFGLESFWHDRFWDAWTAALDSYWRSGWTAFIRSSSTAFLRAAASVVVVMYTGWAASNGQLRIGEVTTTLSLILAAGGANAWSFSEIANGRVALGWLNELTPMSRIPVLLRGRPEQAPHPSPSDLPPQIVFESVSFRYPNGDRDVLENLNFTLASGSATAIVGINGAGKSTLIKLLSGGHRPTGGRILVNGVDLATMNKVELAAWQRRIAPITQDFLRLPVSAADNIELGTGREWSGRIGQPNWPSTDQLDALASQAGVADIVARLPSGWATPLDASLPGGSDLSGGEWQRFALARALRAVDAGARVLVLDEPAAALDARSESRLVMSYLNLAERTTSILISHRFSVVRPVPAILVLEGGRIVERGNHDELLAARGSYYTMFSTQAAQYADPPTPEEST